MKITSEKCTERYDTKHRMIFIGLYIPCAVVLCKACGLCGEAFAHAWLHGAWYTVDRPVVH